MNDGALPSRYSRQILFPRIGEAGQRRLLGSAIAIVGCGALGATLAEQAVRSGVGTVRLIDRDIVEESNLGRQALYTTSDAASHLPKAVALAAHLRDFNPEVSVETQVTDLNRTTIDALLDGVGLVLDGTDNFDTRYLINDWCVSRQVPWIYGACIASRGMTAVVIPGETPCLRCLFPEPPPQGVAETCDTAGIIGPAATIIASLQVAEALKILVGDVSAIRRTLLSVELWPFRLLELGGGNPLPRDDCPACDKGEFPWLSGADRTRTLTYCGRDAVQVVPPGSGRDFDLDAVERRLTKTFEVKRTSYVLRVVVPGFTLTVFDDGRALVSGTGDGDQARAVYDRYIGS
jgi:adenylyltransferase/sulfurtransferase